MSSRRNVQPAEGEAGAALPCHDPSHFFWKQPKNGNRPQRTQPHIPRHNPCPWKEFHLSGLHSPPVLWVYSHDPQELLISDLILSFWNWAKLGKKALWLVPKLLWELNQNVVNEKKKKIMIASKSIQNRQN